MRVTLVGTYTHPVALGLRFVSSYIKSAGHEVEALFMTSRRDTADADFAPAALEAFIERCRKADVIGMSLMTNTFRRSTVLTEAIRKAGIKAPIIWGGTHPTVAPDESLQVADAICVGEGEEPMLQLLERLERGQDPTSVGSFGFRGDGAFRTGRTFRNPVMQLQEELDDYPFADYELDTHWVIEKGELVPARPTNLRGALHRFRIETTRGCPFPCTFCNNAALLNVYKGKGKWVRRRTSENLIREIETARASFPTIEAINIVDDLFFIRDEEEIEEFTELYAKRVNLPLELDAFPNTISERKVSTLARLPLSLISMGIQSASPKTLKEVYKRPTPVEKIAEGIRLFSQHRIRAEYHYIISNPYESDESVIETMRFAATHHRGPAIVRVFPLMFYPGTPLYDQARADGIIGQRDEHAYNYMYSGKLQFAKHDYLSTWLRVVLYLRNVGVPSWFAHRLIDLVTMPVTRKLLDRPVFLPIAFGTYQAFRKLYKVLIYQPFVRPLRFLRRKPRYEELHPEDEVTLPRNAMAADPSLLPNWKLPRLGRPRIGAAQLPVQQPAHGGSCQQESTADGVSLPVMQGP